MLSGALSTEMAPLTFSMSRLSGMPVTLILPLTDSRSRAPRTPLTSIDELMVSTLTGEDEGTRIVSSVCVACLPW